MRHTVNWGGSMMTKWGRSRLFKTYFLSYVIVVVITTSLLGLTLMQLISSAVRTELAGISNNRLAYAESIITKSILEPTEKMVHDHIFSYHLINLKGSYSHYELYRYLKNQITSLPYVTSFEVYYPLERMLISSKQVKYDVEPAWLQKQPSNVSHRQWSKYSEPVTGAIPKQTYLQYSKPSTARGADQQPLFHINVSVNIDAVEQILAAQHTKSKEVITIVNKQNDVISISADLTETDNIRQVALANYKEHGTAFGEYEEMMYTVQYDEKYQWYYVLMMPLTDFLTIIYTIRNTILIVTATIVIIGMLMSLAASIFHFLPMQRIIDYMKDVVGNDENANHEVKFIQDNVKKLYTTIIDLQHKENTNLIGEMLRGVIDTPYEQDIKTIMPFDYYIVATIAVNEQLDIRQIERWGTTWQMTTEILQSRVFVLPYSKEVVAVVINYSGAYEELKRQMKQTIEVDRNEDNIRLRMGVGTIEKELFDVYLSCEHALKALQQYFLLEEPPSMMEHATISSLPPFVWEDYDGQWYRALQHSDSEQIKTVLNKLVTALQEDHYQFESIDRFLLRIFPLITDKLLEYDRKVNIEAEFYGHTTIFEALRWLEELIVDTLMLKAEFNAAVILMERVKGYIDEHYAEELSLELLSQKTFISASYISTMFKKAYDIGVSEYISDLRLEEGSRLLANYSYKVAEIAEMIGIPNTPYFITRFKKKFGQTPNQYRRECVILNLDATNGTVVSKQM